MMSVARDLTWYPMSFRNWIVIDSSQKRYMRKNRFGAPSSLSIRRPKENLGTYSHLRKRSSYSEVTLTSSSTIIFLKKKALLCTPRVKGTAHCLKTKRVALWVQNAKCIMDVETETTTTAPHAGVSERLESTFCSVNKWFSWCPTHLTSETYLKS